jgi:hypothetical protein
VVRDTTSANAARSHHPMPLGPFTSAMTLDSFVALANASPTALGPETAGARLCAERSARLCAAQPEPSRGTWPAPTPAAPRYTVVATRPTRSRMRCRGGVHVRRCRDADGHQLDLERVPLRGSRRRRGRNVTFGLAVRRQRPTPGPGHLVACRNLVFTHPAIARVNPTPATGKAAFAFALAPSLLGFRILSVHRRERTGVDTRSDVSPGFVGEMPALVEPDAQLRLSFHRTT